MPARSWIKPLVVLAMLAAAGSARAALANIEEVPTNWRLQDYIGTPAGVTVWYVANLPAGVCQTQGAGNGHLSFPTATQPSDSGVTSVTDYEVSRFWSMVMTAKTTGQKVGIDYDTSTCIISDFYLDW